MLELTISRHLESAEFGEGPLEVKPDDGLLITTATIQGDVNDGTSMCSRVYFSDVLKNPRQSRTFWWIRR